MMTIEQVEREESTAACLGGTARVVYRPGNRRGSLVWNPSTMRVELQWDSAAAPDIRPAELLAGLEFTGIEPAGEA